MMKQKKQSSKEGKQLFIAVTCGSLTVLSNVSFLPAIAIKTEQQSITKIESNLITKRSFTTVRVAQSPKTTTQNPKRVRAEQLLKQAEELARQTTITSYQQVISLCEEAAKLYLEIGDPTQASEALHIVAIFYGSPLKQPQKALETYKRMLKIEQAAKNWSSQAMIYSFMALVYKYDLEQPQEALSAYNQAVAAYYQALKVWRAQKDLKKQVFTLDKIAYTYKGLEQPEKALTVYNQALKLARNTNDLGEQATILQSMTFLYRDLKQPEKLLAVYNQLLQIYRTHKDASKIASTLSGMHKIYREDLKQPKKADALLNEMQAILHDQKDLTQRVAILQSIGPLYLSSRQFQKALAAYDQLLKIQQTQKDLAGQGRTLDTIADIYKDLNQPQKILEIYNQKLEVHRQQKDFKKQVGTLAGIAVVYKDLNQPLKAIEIFNQILEIEQQQGDYEGQTRTLEGIANIYRNLDQSQKALATYNQALRIAKKQNDQRGQSSVLIGIANIYSSLKKPQKALKAYKQKLEIDRSPQNKLNDLSGYSSEVSTLKTIARIYKENLNQPQKALDCYNQILEVLQAQKKLPPSAQILNLDEEAITLRDMGNLYYNLKQEQRAHQVFKQAIDVYRQKLKILQTQIQGLSDYKLDLNRKSQAITLSQIGDRYGDLGDRPNALSYWVQSFEFRLSYEKDTKAAARWFYRISDLYTRFGEQQKAIDTLNRSLKLQQKNQDQAEQAKVLGQIAEIHGLYGSFGEPQKSLDLYKQALTLQQQAADRSGQVETLANIAQIYLKLGDYQLSTDTSNQALRLAEQIGDRKRQVAVLADISRVYREAESYEKSAILGQQALTLIRSLKKNSKTDSSLKKDSKTEFDRILQEYDVGLKLDLQEFDVQLNLGLAYLELHDYPKALTAANRMMALGRETGFWNGPAYAFTLMGRVYLAQGAYQKALNAFSQALPIFEQRLTPSMDAKVVNDMGRAYVGLKQYPKALKTYNLALTRMRKWGDRSGEVAVLYQIALAERDRGNLKDARTQIEFGIAIVEDLRTKMVDPGLRTAYFASAQKYYQFYIDLLMQLHRQQPSQGYNALALRASERARARNLLESLSEAHADIRQGVDPRLLEQERQLQFKLDAVDKQRIELYSKNQTTQKNDPAQQEGNEPTVAQVQGIDQEQTKLLAQYRNLKAEIRAKSPRYAALTQPQPLTLAELQQQVLDDNTLLLEYFLGKERSYLWAVSKSGITSYELPKQSEVEAATQNFLKTLKNRNARPLEISQTGLPLSKMLLSPVANQLSQKRLLIVSNGALQYLPFTALPTPTGSQLLLSNHEIINLPSASALATLRKELSGRKPAPKAVAVFADPVFNSTDERVTRGRGREPNPNRPSKNSISNEPVSVQILRSASQEAGINFEPLPETRREAQDIAQLLPADTRFQALDFEANKSNILKASLSQYRIVHFATHGILNTTRPEMSAVVFSLVDPNGRYQNGFLRLNDIFNLNLPAELVVLSACKTGLGQNMRGEGLMGLTRGFMYAGTPRIVASLWSVSDESTAVFMTLFYKAMLEKGLPPAAALRSAQLELQKQEKWKSPYYWAAFTIQGEWK